MPMLDTNLDDFDIDSIELPNAAKKSGFVRMIISGPSNSGKTFCFKYLLSKVFAKQYDYFLIYGKTDDTAQEYIDIIAAAGKKYQYFKQFSEGHIDMLKSKQKKFQDEGKLPVRVMIIIDDFNDRNTKYEKGMIDLFTMSRHFCASVVNIVHDLTFVDPSARNSATHIVFTRQDKGAVYETLFKEYFAIVCGRSPQYEGMTQSAIQRDFIEFLDDSAAGYTALILCSEKKKVLDRPTIHTILYKIKAEKVVRKKKMDPASLKQALEQITGN